MSVTWLKVTTSASRPSVMARACFDVPACDWSMVTPGWAATGRVHLNEKLARHIVGGVEKLIG